MAPANQECANTQTAQHENETWTYCTDKNGLEHVRISSVRHGTTYAEDYTLEKGMLISARESTSSEGTTNWMVHYSIKNNRVIDYTSDGLGETEKDDWMPESIFTQWENRQKILPTLFRF